MKKLLAIITSVVILLVLTACGEKTLSEMKEKSSSEFNVGDVVVSSLGESYTMLLTIDDELKNDTVEITSHKIEAVKKLDITNAEDYFLYGKYCQYLYVATVSGKVDVKYAGKTIHIYNQYPISVQTEVVNGYQYGALVNEDGSFTLVYNVYCNETLETFYPYWITMGS